MGANLNSVLTDFSIMPNPPTQSHLRDYVDDYSGELFGTSSSDGVLDVYLDGVLLYYAMLATVVACINITSKIIKTWLTTEKLDPIIVIRPTLLVICILFYRELLFITLLTPSQLLDNVFLDGLTQFESSYGTAMSKLTYYHTGYNGDGILELLMVIIFALIHLLIVLIAMCAFAYVLFKQAVQKAIFFCIGPLALVLSIVPGNDKVLVKWYQGFLAVLLWRPLTDIIRACIIAMPVVTVRLSNGYAVFSIAIKAVLVFTIFKVPEYCEILVDNAPGIKVASETGLGSDVRKFLMDKSGKAMENAGKAMKNRMGKGKGKGKGKK